MGDLLKRAKKEIEEGNQDALHQLRSLGNVYLHHREISIMEAIYRVTGMKLKQSTRDTIFVPTDPDAVRISKPLSMLSDEADSEDIWMKSLYDRYLARPSTGDFDDMCLAVFASEYRIESRSDSQTCHASEFDDDVEEESSSTHQPRFQLNNGLGTIVKRRKPAVVRYPHFNQQKDSERYYANILTMYFPHRVKHVKSSSEITFEQVFQEHSSVVLQNMSSFEKMTRNWMLRGNSFKLRGLMKMHGQKLHQTRKLRGLNHLNM